MRVEPAAAPLPLCPLLSVTSPCRRFFKSPNFDGWYRQRHKEMTQKLEALHLEAICEAVRSLPALHPERPWGPTPARGGCCSPGRLDPRGRVGTGLCRRPVRVQGGGPGHEQLGSPLVSSAAPAPAAPVGRFPLLSPSRAGRGVPEQLPGCPPQPQPPARRALPLQRCGAGSARAGGSSDRPDGHSASKAAPTRDALLAGGGSPALPAPSPRPSLGAVAGGGAGRALPCATRAASRRAGGWETCPL